MIELSILAPLPLQLGLSDSATSMDVQLPFHAQITIETVFEALAGDHPGFERLLHGVPSDLISGLLVSVDSKLLYRKEELKEPLQDGCKILLIAPYAGG